MLCEFSCHHYSISVCQHLFGAQRVSSVLVQSTTACETFRHIMWNTPQKGNNCCCCCVLTTRRLCLRVKASGRDKGNTAEQAEQQQERKVSQSIVASHLGHPKNRQLEQPRPSTIQHAAAQISENICCSRPKTTERLRRCLCFYVSKLLRHTNQNVCIQDKKKSGTHLDSRSGRQPRSRLSSTEQLIPSGSGPLSLLVWRGSENSSQQRRREIRGGGGCEAAKIDE